MAKERPQAADPMGLAMAEARAAAARGEAPIGAAVTRDGQVVALAGNRTRERADPTAHAELLAIRAAAAALGAERLVDCDPSVTLEPCAMCGRGLRTRASAGALLLRRPRPGRAARSTTGRASFASRRATMPPRSTAASAKARRRRSCARFLRRGDSARRKSGTGLSHKGALKSRILEQSAIQSNRGLL